jgi:hypothetical protein
VEILPYTGPFPNALRRFDSRAAFEVKNNEIYVLIRINLSKFSYIQIVESIILLLQQLKMLKHGQKKSNLVFSILKKIQLKSNLISIIVIFLCAI